jgi:transcriptional regulator with XRE-family HTH domain
LRTKDGLSVEELADRVDMHPQSLRNIELERRPISLKKLNLIARALCVDTAAIARRDVDEIDENEGGDES